MFIRVLVNILLDPPMVLVLNHYTQAFPVMHIFPVNHRHSQLVALLNLQLQLYIHQSALNKQDLQTSNIPKYTLVLFLIHSHNPDMPHHL